MLSLVTEENNLMGLSFRPLHTGPVEDMGPLGYSHPYKVTHLIRKRKSVPIGPSGSFCECLVSLHTLAHP